MSPAYLEFDLSEDADGLSTWDALASPPATHTGALLAEVRALLRLLQQLGPAGPVDEGHDWDMDLQLHDEHGQVLSIDGDGLPVGRVSLALSLTGRSALAAAIARWTRS